MEAACKSNKALGCLYFALHTIYSGINYLAMGLALLIEGYLFYFHTHGRTMLEIQIHVLLVIAIWTGAAAFAFLWHLEAYHTKGMCYFELEYVPMC